MVNSVLVTVNNGLDSNHTEVIPPLITEDEPIGHDEIIGSLVY